MIRFEELDSLKPHEGISKKNFRKLMTEILRDGMIRNPIAVDMGTKTILDGHHRQKILIELGLSKIPVFFVDYSDPKIKVRSRNGLRVSKNLVIRKAMAGDLYPPKTTKHIIPRRPKNINIELEKLK